MPFFTSLGVGSHLESWVSRKSASRARLVESAPIAGGRARVSGRAFAALFRARAGHAQHHGLVVVFAQRRAPRLLLQRRHRPHHRVLEHRRKAWPLRSGRARGRRPFTRRGATFISVPRMRSRRSRCWRRALLPVHWGTFNLAMHDWTSRQKCCSSSAKRAAADATFGRSRGAKPSRRRYAVVAHTGQSGRGQVGTRA